MFHLEFEQNCWRHPTHIKLLNWTHAGRRMVSSGRLSSSNKIGKDVENNIQRNPTDNDKNSNKDKTDGSWIYQETKCLGLVTKVATSAMFKMSQHSSTILERTWAESKGRDLRRIHRSHSS
ncbi:hypothetical protein RUM44_008772 [Polyplax serrata]|uniref:Uncharacterized protein n=1 Tax=Polyplax serrata TaxID=468196 RepID=A0ABR1B975_POLSC